MSRSPSLLRAFNVLFAEFMDYVTRACPANAADLEMAARTFETLRKLNPALIAKAWRAHVYEPYRDLIDQSNDLSFLTTKNYADDLRMFANARDILQIIDALRAPLEDMAPEHRDATLHYIRQLSALSLRTGLPAAAAAAK